MDRIFWLTCPLHAGGGGDDGAALHIARRLLSEGGGLSGGQTALYVVISVLLVIFAGMMAGLTLGLLSLGEPLGQYGSICWGTAGAGGWLLLAAAGMHGMAPTAHGGRQAGLAHGMTCCRLMWGAPLCAEAICLHLCKLIHHPPLCRQGGLGGDSAQRLGAGALAGGTGGTGEAHSGVYLPCCLHAMLCACLTRSAVRYQAAHASCASWC